MSMLSSVAERLYWTARYLERAESTARLANAYSQFILDIPVGLEPGWDSLVRTINGNAAFENRYKRYTERNVLKFLVADADSMASVRYSINAARQNVRTTRDCLPESYWELVNELNIYVREHATASVTRRDRFEFLDTIAARTQQLTGLIQSNMTRDHAYRFIRLGRMVECADMTSRFVDVATATTIRLAEEDAAAASWLWVNLLGSLSAQSAYRREVGPVVDAADIIDFIFKSKSFPRSIHYCLNSIDEEVQSLVNPKHVWFRARQARSKLLAFDTGNLSLRDLHDRIDELQVQLIKLDDEIRMTWFSR